MKLLFTLLFTVSLWAQTPTLKVKIDTIIVENSNPKKRTFVIQYHIENTSPSTVSFFLKPQDLIAFAASSLTLYPIYKIYQNNHCSALDGPFYERKGNGDWNKYLEMADQNPSEAKALLKKIKADYELQTHQIIEDYQKSGGQVEDRNWILRNHQLLRSKITLQPQESKSFTIQTSWNKERYYLQDDLEYYLDAKDVFEFDLTLNLIKIHFEDQLSAEEFTTIAKDPKFLEGIYTSNKVVIDFGT